MRLLVVEDEVKLAALLKRGLAEEGYAVDVASDGKQAKWLVAESAYEAIVLDVLLPDENGFDVCAELRRSGCWSPVLILTALDGVSDRIKGLDAGADDYLAKPFAFEELLARLRALTRRESGERPVVLQVADLSLNPATHYVQRGNSGIELTRKEFALLEYFMRHVGEVLSRTTLIEHVWDFAFDSDSNVVDVYVRYLREKIDRPFNTDSIETVRGVGYRFREVSAGAATHQD